MSFKPEDVRFDERGLVPAIVQDARTREVLTLAYMNEESLRRTLAEGETWFWSRSRSELWHKGATSGNTQRVVSVRLDCDADAVIVLVEPRGPACHTGATSCFHQDSDGLGSSNARADAGGASASDEGIGAVLENLYEVIEGRRREMPEGSYTTYLFEKGLNKILKKVGEESAETIIAAKDEDLGALTSETADLVYHLLVLLVKRGVKLEDLGRELARRRKGKGSE
ncbi:MAG TPA: bifunctional phosphoribosyl-AMP cyclohydrolase/phosphoribosyl-ATP diphosphatase HisIE [Pyrinomonadaceae bacterium]|nr:bifunctional phosphoribosyl-AMP cyclohydrolase/phosphoribosyl-ATP diphosphatase HisIE [Pyrinomonadaceae bacterium]